MRLSKNPYVKFFFALLEVAVSVCRSVGLSVIFSRFISHAPIGLVTVTVDTHHVQLGGMY